MLIEIKPVIVLIEPELGIRDQVTVSSLRTMPSPEEGERRLQASRLVPSSFGIWQSSTMRSHTRCAGSRSRSTVMTT